MAPKGQDFLFEGSKLVRNDFKDAPGEMALVASLSNPYIVEYKDGWVEKIPFGYGYPGDWTARGPPLGDGLGCTDSVGLRVSGQAVQRTRAVEAGRHSWVG
ncbi:Serine/threonine-protein kinase Nek6 [Platanthera guangdongensis]|uniref:Serine/threonine-protein kinase Nek6 n=1 Tax=Platanthera guangdongensis TaxID=2320717 RepID=A0ABR2LTJ8_9ASPA